MIPYAMQGMKDVVVSEEEDKIALSEEWTWSPDIENPAEVIQEFSMTTVTQRMTGTVQSDIGEYW